MTSAGVRPLRAAVVQQSAVIARLFESIAENRQVRPRIACVDRLGDAGGGTVTPDQHNGGDGGRPKRCVADEAAQHAAFTAQGRGLDQPRRSQAISRAARATR